MQSNKTKLNKTKLDYEIVSKTRNVKPRVKDVDQTIRFKITGFDSYFYDF